MYSSGPTAIDGTQTYMYVATIAEPPSGQIYSDSNIDQVATQWIGMTPDVNGSGGIAQTGYAQDATHPYSSGYELWWEYTADPSYMTPYTTSSYASAGDKLFATTYLQTGGKFYFEACDDSKSGSP
jgi:hypothetical protein